LGTSTDGSTSDADFIRLLQEGGVNPPLPVHRRLLRLHPLIKRNTIVEQDYLFLVWGFATEPMTIYTGFDFDAAYELIKHPELTFFEGAMLYLHVVQKEKPQ
jgi:hypothetical protein